MGVAILFVFSFRLNLIVIYEVLCWVFGFVTYVYCTYVYCGAFSSVHH